MELLIKNIGNILCWLCFYISMLNIEIQKRKKIMLLIFVLLISACSFFIFNKLPYISSIFIFCCMALTIKLSINKYRYVLEIQIISYAIMYLVFIVSVFLISLFFSIITTKTYALGSQCATVLIELLITYLLTNNKRLNKGLKLIRKSNYLYPIMYISLVIYWFSIVFNIKQNNSTRKNIYISLVVLSILFFEIWRTSISKYYIDKLVLRNIESLNAELTEKNELIRKLKKDNEHIEKINHKNYKLVPAMHEAVEVYMKGIMAFADGMGNDYAATKEDADKDVSRSDVADFIKRGNELLGELNKMQDEWKEVANQEAVEYTKEIPECGIERIDYIIRYMYGRAENEDVGFKVIIDCDVTDIVKRSITEEDFATLIADLIENAIIATRYTENKDILIRIGLLKKKVYTLEVFDSGIPFTKEVLYKYGIERITTHQDESGSGIGMMQTYEILSRCGGSIFIDEFPKNSGLFTKKISVVFNRKHQYVLYTKRSDEDIAFLKKRADLTISRK